MAIISVFTPLYVFLFHKLWFFFVHIYKKLVYFSAKTGEATEQQRLERLKLALKWDRADIAQEEIFREDALWSRSKSLTGLIFLRLIS